MELPTSLPARLYLLACDVTKHRVTGRDQLGYVLRAGALTDLVLAGALTAGDGGPAVGRTGPTDAYQAAVHAEIAASRGRSWAHWVRRGARRARGQVEDQLVAAGWITVEPHRVLGIFPTRRVSVRDIRGHRALVVSLGHLVRGTEPVSRVTPRDAALVALAAAGELRAVLSRADCRQYQQRIEKLTESVGPVAPVLRKVLRQIRTQRAAAASGASG